MFSSITDHVAVNAAAIIAVAALAFRDQLKLRLLLLVSTGLTLMTVLLAAPLMWDTLFWNVVNWLINGWVTVQIVLDRTHIGLSGEEERLFDVFDSLTPGEFRKLVRSATWHTAAEMQVLTREGVVPARLYYVLDGAIEIIKGDRTGSLAGGTFIGEIAFVRGTPASATVSVGPGARYIEWDTGKLKAMLDRHHHLRVAVTHLLSADMAVKIARASTG